MKTVPIAVGLVASAAFWSLSEFAVRAAPAQQTEEIRIVTAKGTIEMWPAGANRWVRTQTNEVLRSGDRLRTGRNSSVVLRWSDQSIATFGAETEMEVVPPHQPDAWFGVNIFKGLLSFFNRDKPNRIQVITRGAVAGVEGTEFVVNVEPVDNTEETTLFVIDGIVRLANDQAVLVLTNGQAATARPGKPPVLIAGFIANNIIQWALYYPAILDLRDLSLSQEERAALSKSLEAYGQGDLLAALREYPEDRKPASDADRVYHAALLINVGQIDQAATELKDIQVGRTVPGEPRRLGEDASPYHLADALRQMIAAVKREPFTPSREPASATELLAASYYEQSKAILEDSLRAALHLAREAVAKSPDFGFGWARVAELEFGFGRVKAARAAAENALALTPRNAQAMALEGFLYLAENRPRQAITWFDKAIAVDASLANAWLGRGLARIRVGRTVPGEPGLGEEDLLVAAALEPQRSLLRSYLGKSYRDPAAAEHELDLAIKLDPGDPTPWLYSALIKAQNNRINEAIRDLEKSQELNENRRLYRSQLLLDQDRAVRSANLASIYRDAGMTEWSLQEAGRAVSYDYANYSAHLFLANSYDQLRDPNRINLRYETPAQSEYLIANLLAPVGAGLMAQSISRQEYSKLFERDHVGVASFTEYLSRGAWLEHGAQFGVFRNSSYLFEARYRTDPGERPNGDFEERELRLHLKQQITSQDSFYFRAIHYNAEGGDVRQFYDPRDASRELRTREWQEPILHLGYHREWKPGVHTLLLAGRLNDRVSVRNPLQPTYFIIKLPDFPANDFELMFANLRYRSAEEIYTADFQQIWTQGDHNTVVGGRFQTGEINTRSLQTDPVVLGEILGYFEPGPLAQQDIHSDFERLSFYAYHNWQIWPSLNIIGGVAYDRMRFPENFRAPPLSDREEETERVSPKAGLVWAPTERTAFRFAYSRALLGATIDQTFSLEPTQVAGFNQSYRSVTPESIAGSAIGARFESFSAALEQRVGSGTYLAVSGQILDSQENRVLGAFRYDRSSFWAQPSLTRNPLDYTEKSLVLSLNQLVQKEWSFGASYRLTQAEVKDDFTEVSASTALVGVRRRQKLNASLHQVMLHAGYNHPSGFFGQFQTLWSEQSNRGYSPGIPGDDFWQHNALAGYRFPRRRAEVQLGVLNLTGQDYRLNPLTLYTELPRERTLVARFQLNF